MNLRIIIVMIFLLSVFVPLIMDDASAFTKSEGKKNPKSNLKQICGDDLCEEPLSAKEKIRNYLSEKNKQTLAIQQGFKPTVKIVDTDKDKIPDSQDNCRAVPNKLQENTDNDRQGDACDDDDDNDGFPDYVDRCTRLPEDGIGNSHDGCPQGSASSPMVTPPSEKKPSVDKVTPPTKESEKETEKVVPLDQKKTPGNETKISAVSGLNCGLEPTVTGTELSDTLYGTSGNDLIYGYGGNDKIFGMDGDDIICGGFGDDEIHGDDGNDIIYGEEGADVISGNMDDDEISGGKPHDSGSEDVSDGESGDLLFGGPGSDICKNDPLVDSRGCEN